MAEINDSFIIILCLLKDLIWKDLKVIWNTKNSKRKKYNIKAGCSVTEENVLINDEEIIEDAIKTNTITPYF
jgi:hypothetical protein